MDADLSLTLGVVLLVLSVPAMVAAYAERRRPRLSLLAAVGGALLIGWAWHLSGGYGWRDVPEALVRVAARLLG
jgi:hypothetical protein